MNKMLHKEDICVRVLFYFSFSLSQKTVFNRQLHSLFLKLYDTSCLQFRTFFFIHNLKTHLMDSLWLVKRDHKGLMHHYTYVLNMFDMEQGVKKTNTG